MGKDILAKRDFLLSLNGRWWYEYQSPLTCKLGSDGVGHDLIHPVDQLQGACRNAWALLSTVGALTEDFDLEMIKLDKLVAQNTINMDTFEVRERQVLINRSKRRLAELSASIQERGKALEVFIEHAVELHKQVSETYKDYDDALPHIFTARIGYNTLVKSFPLVGQDIKSALLTEEQKAKALEVLGIPKTISENGVDLPIWPDAKMVLERLKQFQLKELNGDTNG